MESVSIPKLVMTLLKALFSLIYHIVHFKLSTKLVEAIYKSMVIRYNSSLPHVIDVMAFIILWGQIQPDKQV